MNLEINQQNLYMLLPSKVAWLADMLVEAKGGNILGAVKEIYSSAMYQNLENEETKLWNLGPVALYEQMEGV